MKVARGCFALSELSCLAIAVEVIGTHILGWPRQST